MTNLPSSWSIAILGDVCELVGGGTPSRAVTEYFNGDILWLTPTEIDKVNVKLIKDSKEKISELGYRKSSAKMVPKGTVLLTSRASIGFVAVAGKELSTNQGFASLICNNNLYNFFLGWWLKSVTKLLIEKATGTTFKEISKNSLKQVEIPLPPLPEQHRIVAKLEELFSQLDIAVSEMKRAKQQIKTYKQSILASAFSGKLSSSMQNVECKIYNEETGLPEGWKWVKLGEVLELSQKRFVPNGSNKYYLGLEHIGKNSGKILKDFEFEPISTIKNSFSTGDILYGKLRPYLNKVAIANNDGVCSTDILVFTPKSILNKYIHYFMLSLKFVNDTSANTSGINLPRVSTKYLLNYLIPIANLDIQIEIANEIEARFSESENLDKTIDLSLLQAESLRQSILKKAFEGRLVPQDPNDESASVLLERIRKEKLLHKNGK